MNPKMVEMRFSRTLLMSTMGLSMELFNQMLGFLPSDVKFMGCGSDNSSYMDSLFFASDSFKEVPAGHQIPLVTPNFIRNSDGSVKCSGMDLSHVLINSNTCTYNIRYIPILNNVSAEDIQKNKITICIQHNYIPYQGLNETYDYCKQCNERKS